MRAVIDTNVLLAGFLWHGPPHILIEHNRARSLTLIVSPALLAEFDRVVRRSKFSAILSSSETSPDQMLQELQQTAEIYDPAPLPRQVCRDPDDDAVLALAVASRADVIVSGDKDLLTLGVYADIPIVGVTEAIARPT